MLTKQKAKCVIQNDSRFNLKYACHYNGTPIYNKDIIIHHSTKKKKEYKESWIGDRPMQWNKDKTKYLLNNKYVHLTTHIFPGVSYILKNGDRILRGNTMLVPELPIQRQFTIKNGDVVERFYKMGIMSFLILMNDVVNRTSDKNDLSVDTIFNKCNNILPNRLKLIKGDACDTCVTFKNENPGTRIKLLYLDMDLDKPTFTVLINLWSLIVKHGIVVLDEYGYHKWDESNGVDRFLKTINGQYTLKNTNIRGPTLVIKKNIL